MVVSDHGMQENGNHGGSSYEETDSLAFFIGARSGLISATDDTINQVLVYILILKVQNCCYVKLCRFGNDTKTQCINQTTVI